jgi:hypothetical protein
MKELKSWPRSLLDEARQNAYFERCHPLGIDEESGDYYLIEPAPLFVHVLCVIGSEIARLWWEHVQTCDHHGHYHPEDWGGPDSGGMGGYCDRCGFSFHHVMY